MSLNSKVTRNKNRVPVIALFCLCAYTAYEVFFGYVVGTLQNVLAFASVLACFIVYFFARKQFKYAVFATLVLGLTGVLNFTPFTYIIGIGAITFHVIPFLFMVFYFLLNWKRIFSTKATDVAVPDNEKVENLMTRYENKTTEELETIINSPSYGIDAKTAASQVLNMRGTSNTEETITGASLPTDDL